MRIVMDVLILVLRKISSYLMAIPLFIGILPGVMFAFYMILPENPPELLVVFVCCYTSGAFAILFITVLVGTGSFLYRKQKKNKNGTWSPLPFLLIACLKTIRILTYLTAMYFFMVAWKFILYVMRVVGHWNAPDRYYIPLSILSMISLLFYIRTRELQVSYRGMALASQIEHLSHAVFEKINLARKSESLEEKRTLLDMNCFSIMFYMKEWDTVCEMIQLREDANLKDPVLGSTLLMHAVAYERPEFVQACLQYHPDLAERNICGYSAFDYAKRTFNPEIMRLLNSARVNS